MLDEMGGLGLREDVRWDGRFGVGEDVRWDGRFRC